MNESAVRNKTRHDGKLTDNGNKFSKWMQTLLGWKG